MSDNSHHGKKLIATVLESTGLPPDAIEQELYQLLNQHEINPEDLTVSDLRRVLVNYLQEIIVEAKQSHKTQ